MAATTPKRPVAPEITTAFAGLEELADEPPEPELVPGLRVPVPPGWLRKPSQVYGPRMTSLEPCSGLKWLQAESMFLVDWRLKAPLTRLSCGRDTLEKVSTVNYVGSLIELTS